MVEEDETGEETGEARMIYARLNERDHGRAWVVLFASFLVQLLMDGTISSYGVLLTKMRDDTKFMEANYTEAEFNLPGAIQPCLYIFMSIGFGTLSVCAIVSVSYYFDKYRALASGIASAGNGVGYCVIPLLMDTLTQLLGWRMTLLVFSIACTAIFCLAVLTMKPLRVLPILTEEPCSTSIAQYSRTGRTSLAENLEPSRGYTHLETVEEEEDDDDDAETVLDSPRDHPASWSGELSLRTDDPGEVPQTFDREDPTKRILKGRVQRGFSMPTMSPDHLSNLINSLTSARNSKSGGKGGDCITATNKSLKRGVSNIDGHRVSLFRPKRGFIINDTSFGPYRRLSSLFRRKLSAQAERSLFNESLFHLTPRPSLQSQLAPRQTNPSATSNHMHDFRESSLRLGNGTYIGRPLTLNPLSRADSFYSASLASLRYRDRRIREAVRSSTMTESELEVSFKSCLSFDLPTGLQTSRRLTSASGQSRQQQPCENSIATRTIADELAQGVLAIEGEAARSKSTRHVFRQLGGFLNTHFDLSLLRAVDFWIITALFFTAQLAYFIPFVYLVEYAKECDRSPREAVFLLMIIGITNTVGRCFCGVLGNIHRLDVILISFVSCCMTAGCQFLLTIMPKRFADLAFYAGTYGFFVSYLTLSPIVIVNVLGLEKLTATYGNASFFRGIAAAIGPILAGLITKKDNCLPVFYFCGVCFAVCSLLHLGFYRQTLRKRLQNLLH
uniref:Monocarboxylate transporter 5 n=1 Tax=Schistocephalus solidus TaxID=70667 RepID=A0A0X3Q2I7_SCHSO